jgi:hypothetical protein
MFQYLFTALRYYKYDLVTNSQYMDGNGLMGQIKAGPLLQIGQRPRRTPACIQSQNRLSVPAMLGLGPQKSLVALAKFSKTQGP